MKTPLLKTDRLTFRKFGIVSCKGIGTTAINWVMENVDGANRNVNPGCAYGEAGYMDDIAYAAHMAGFPIMLNGELVVPECPEPGMRGGWVSLGAPVYNVFCRDFPGVPISDVSLTKQEAQEVRDHWRKVWDCDLTRGLGAMVRAPRYYIRKVGR